VFSLRRGVIMVVGDVFLNYIMALKLICVATLATAIPLAAFNHSAGKKESEFDKIWETTMRQGKM